MNYIDILKSQPLTTQVQLSINGYDAHVYLGNGLSKSTRIKCSTFDNFVKYGRNLKSFVLGASNDVTAASFITSPIEHCDLLLTGYEVEKDILCPYVLIYWPIFIRRIYTKREKVNTETDKDGRTFAWIKYEDIPKVSICSMNLDGF